MDNSIQKFIDGISNLNFTQGTFRFDLVSIGNITKTDDGTTKPELETHMKVIMTPNGFVQAINAMQKFIKEVEEQDIITSEKRKGSVEEG